MIKVSLRDENSIMIPHLKVSLRDENSTMIPHHVCEQMKFSRTGTSSDNFMLQYSNDFFANQYTSILVTILSAEYNETYSKKIPV